MRKLFARQQRLGQSGEQFLSPPCDDGEGKLDALRTKGLRVLRAGETQLIHNPIQRRGGGPAAGVAEDVEMLLVRPEEDSGVPIPAVERHARVARVALEFLLGLDILQHFLASISPSSIRIVPMGRRWPLLSLVPHHQFATLVSRGQDENQRGQHAIELFPVALLQYVVEFSQNRLAHGRPPSADREVSIR